MNVEKMTRTLGAALVGSALSIGVSACGSDAGPGGMLPEGLEQTTAGVQQEVQAGQGALPQAGTAAQAGVGMPVAGTGAPPVAGTGAAAGTGTVPTAGTGVERRAGDGAMVTAGVGGTGFEDPRGKCDIESGFMGDEACLLPPAPGEGLQIHVGPDSYDNTAIVNALVIQPGEENSLCWNFVTPNAEEVYFQGWALSGRPGTHHIITTMYRTALPPSSALEICRDPGTGSSPDSLGNLPGASKPYMPREPIAPENMGLGELGPAATHAQADMHYFNFGEGPLLREFWLNLYFIDKDKVTEQANQIRLMGGLNWLLLPFPARSKGTCTYECSIQQDGRIVQLLGHMHSHGVRNAAYLQRTDGTREKVFEMFDYLDPQIFYYNTVTQNPQFAPGSAGAISGVLEVKAGDRLIWDCDIENPDEFGLRYTNEVVMGEMCNVWGSVVGPRIDCVYFSNCCTT